MNNKYYREDLKDVIDTALSLGFKGKSFLVTGATGMIGSVLVDALRNITYEHCIYLVGRDVNKIKSVFGDGFNTYDYKSIDSIDADVEYIIHLASPTTSSYLSNNPVETIDLIYSTTKQLLDFSMKHHSKFLYVSSMEVYGEIYDENIRGENDLGYISLTNTRNSYPEAKRLCELLCYSYYKEYGLDINVARLSQTFGAGTSIDDPRIFGYIARCIRDKKDIVLKTKGDSIGNYCYLSDALRALFYILSRGNNGETYNVVGDNTRSSIYDMAAMIAKELSNNAINVVVDIDTNELYPNPTKLYMSNAKLKGLGWKPKYNLLDMFKRMIG